MPKCWQASLGLGLEENGQLYEGLTHADADYPNETFTDETAPYTTGYRFQRDDTINRGYVHSQPRTMELDSKARYLLSLYLVALQQHQNKDYLGYLTMSTQTYSFPYYTAVAPVVRGLSYFVFGRTMLPSQGRIYSEADGREISFDIAYLDALEPKMIIDGSKLYDIRLDSETAQEPTEDEQVESPADRPEADTTPLTEEEQAELDARAKADALEERDDAIYEFFNAHIDDEEYLMLEIKSQSPIAILAHSYIPGSGDSQMYEAMPTGLKPTDDIKAMYPRCGFMHLDYSDKLIPALLDIQINEDSPQEMKDLLNADSLGSSLADTIRKSTESVYDRDGNMGPHFKRMQQ